MPDELTLHLDLGPLKERLQEYADIIEERMQIAAQNLSNMTYSHIKEEASSRLRTRRDMYLDNLDFFQAGPSTYVIILKEKGLWIEEGREPGDMLADLLKSPKAKTSKKGTKYLVIPFKHNKGPTQQTPHQAQLKEALKDAFKKAKIPYGKIERNTDGSPKTGLLHKMNINAPNQNRPVHGSQGPVGHPMGVNSPGGGQEGPSGRPYLWGVRVYQHAQKNPDGFPKTDKKGQQMASREIMTFRVASSSQAGTGKWFHPGLAPVHLFEEAHQWAQLQWETMIEPEILKGLGS